MCVPNELIVSRDTYFYNWFTPTLQYSQVTLRRLTVTARRLTVTVIGKGVMLVGSPATEMA